MQPITDPLAKTETKITTMILDHCDHDKYKYVYIQILIHTNRYTYKMRNQICTILTVLSILALAHFKVLTGRMVLINDGS